MDSYSEKARQDILASLWDNPSSADLEPLHPNNVQTKLHDLVKCSDDILGIKRFNNVYILALLQLQHEIVLLEEELSQGVHVDTNRLCKRLSEYASLVKSYKELSILNRVTREGAESIAKRLATELHEPRYWYAPDAFDCIDLLPEVQRGTGDFIRKILQQKLPPWFLDRTGREMRALDKAEGRNEKPSTGIRRTVIDTHKRHGRYISPGVDNCARVLFALLGGLFLLIPMVTLSYITEKRYLIMTTALSVLFFSLCLGYFSKGSNHELVAATAAYAAVLVVFVGNSIGPNSSK